jgi:hypothetical protein
MTAHHTPTHKPTAVVRHYASATAPITLNIGDQVIVGGQLFTVSATLVPAAAAPPVVTPPIVVPPPPPPALCPIPLVSGYRDANRNPPAAPDFALHAGTVAFVDGSCFGSVPGSLSFSIMPPLGTGLVVPLQVLSWSVAEISYIVPPFTSPQALGNLTVTRADGVSQAFRGFSVVP